LFAAFRRPDGKPAKLPSFVRFVRREQLCGGRDADVVQLRSQRGPDIGDAVQMQWHDMRATATYFYPSTASPDPKAEAAIRSICPNG